MRGLRMLALFALCSLLCAAGCSGNENAATPHINAVQPRRLSGGAPGFLIIQGSHFARGASASLGSAPVAALTWVNAGTLTAEAPPDLAPGAYSFTVVNPGGGRDTLPAALTVGAAAAPPARTPPPAAAAATRPPSPAETPFTVTPSRQTPAAASPTITPSPRPATATPAVPARETATAAAPAPARPATPNPAAGGQALMSSPPNLTGAWQIIDSVNYGPGTGQMYTFTVQIQQQGTAISGAGDGLRFNGGLDGRAIHVSYVQDGGATGTFEWTLDIGDASFQGSFTNSNGNGGASNGQRLGAAAYERAPARPAAIIAVVHGNGKKQSH